MSYFSVLTLIFFYLSYFIYLSHASNKGFSVEMIHRDSSKSPLYHPTETKFQRAYNVVHRSINRVNYFTKQFSLNTNQPVSTLTPEIGEYLISYSVGTPPFKVYGFMDTGSNIVWLQCQPCHTCFNQTSPIFNPSKSSSYKNIPCSSSTCKDTNETHISCSHGGDVCEYSITYGGDAKSQGDLSKETLTLNSTSGSSVLFPNIVIGCGHINVLQDGSKSSGVVGMGSGPMSLVKQVGSSVGSKFSYCLIPYNSDSRESNSSSKLIFGEDVVSGEMVVSTPMVKVNGQEHYYFLALEAFSVGNNRIEYGERENASTRNILIDSGTSLTMLPNLFLSKLVSYVAQEIKLPRIEPPDHRLSLCYNTTGKQLNVPDITAHFNGADVKLNSNGTFFPFEEGIMCFGFISSKGIEIFGNIAQNNLLIGYDLEKEIISFKPADCTKY